MGWGAHTAGVEDSWAPQATRVATEGWKPGPGRMPWTYIHPIPMNMEGGGLTDTCRGGSRAVTTLGRFSSSGEGGKERVFEKAGKELCLF